ncbi:chemotaxis protein histidine kinase CheA [Oxalobacteraceae bacterium GrIS 2.11]
MSADEQQRAKELADAIAALGDVFIGRIPGALADMNQLLQTIGQNAEDQPTWKTLHRQLHSLAGSAGTFGYTELGDRARELENRINDMFKANDLYSEPTRSTFIRDQQAFMAWVEAQYAAR